MNNINQFSTKAVKRESRLYLGKFLLLGFYSHSKIISLDAHHIIKKATNSELENFNRWIKFDNHKSYKYLLHYHYKSKQTTTFPVEIDNQFNWLNVFFKIFQSGSISVPYCNHFVKDIRRDKCFSPLEDRT